MPRCGCSVRRHRRRCSESCWLRCSNEWAGKVGASWGDEEDSGREKLEKTAGHTLVKISPAQMDAWKKAVQPIYTDWVKAASATGVPRFNTKSPLSRPELIVAFRSASNMSGR